MTVRQFGRKPAPDERDINFTIKSMMAGVNSPRGDLRPTSKHWWGNGWWGDQTNTPQCVAYAWLHWVEDGPTTHNPTKPGAEPNVRPLDVYNQCQSVDEWPGTNYDGTSVRAGAKVLSKLGYITSYHWAWDLDSLINSVLNLGPVVVGTNWYSGMLEPTEKDSMIFVEGAVYGGHAYLINGVNRKTGIFRIKNSWGRGWGDSGHAHISFEDMEQLIEAGGEICLAKERKIE